MLVKVCGITNLEDALAAIEAGAGALGFNFYPPSPRYIEPEAVKEITSALPAGVLKVGVFVNEAKSRIEQISRAAGLQIAQLHGNETIFDAPDGVAVWKAYRVGLDFHLTRLADFPASAYLLDAPGELYGGSGKTFDWTLARGVECRIILAGGLDAGNVAEAIRIARPWGVDACSRLESAPGKKDHQKMQLFIQAVLAS
jgi:phosphoribosylanthranilate isomerase